MKVAEPVRITIFCMKTFSNTDNYHNMVHIMFTDVQKNIQRCYDKNGWQSFSLACFYMANLQRERDQMMGQN